MKNITVIFFIILTISACNKTAENKPDIVEHAPHEQTENRVEITQEQYQTAGMKTGPSGIRNLSDVVNANGNIDIPPQNLVSISAPMGGFIRKTDLLQGMEVKKGQILAIIENPDFIQIQQDYLETESKLEYALLEYERQSKLNKENVNAQKVLQQANSEVKIQAAKLAGLKERLKTAGISLKTLSNGTIVNYAPVVSPISGSVTTVNVNIGKYVNPTDVMFEIVDTHHLHVELSVFEQDIPKIKLGQLVRFTVTNNPRKENIARVYLINQKINEDRTVRVHCHLTNDDPGLLPQNFVKAVIETGANPVTALPDEAIVDFEGKPYIFIQNIDSGNKDSVRLVFEMKEVQRGVSENGYSQVKFSDGFDSSKAKIALKGAYMLLSKLKNSEEDDEH